MAASERITLITEQLLTILAADLGTTDLSATGRVARGRWVVPSTIPFLAIALDGIGTNETDPPMGRFVRAAVFRFEGWNTTPTATPAGAMVSDATMASEVFSAVESAHRDAAGSLKSASFMIRNLYFDDYRQHDVEIEGHPFAHWTAKLVVVYHVDRGL